MNRRDFNNWVKRSTLVNPDLRAFIQTVLCFPEQTRILVKAWLARRITLPEQSPDKLQWRGLKVARAFLDSGRKHLRIVFGTLKTVYFVIQAGPDFIGTFADKTKLPIEMAVRDQREIIAKAEAKQKLSFPKEIVRMLICDYLEPEELLQASMVNKRWHVHALSERTWRKWGITPTFYREITLRSWPVYHKHKTFYAVILSRCQSPERWINVYASQSGIDNVGQFMSLHPCGNGLNGFLFRDKTKTYATWHSLKKIGLMAIAGMREMVKRRGRIEFKGWFK